MAAFLFMAGVIGWVIGFSILGFAQTTQSAIHEIEAGLAFLIGTVFFVGGAIVSAIRSIKVVIPDAEGPASTTKAPLAAVGSVGQNEGEGERAPWQPPPFLPG